MRWILNFNDDVDNPDIDYSPMRGGVYNDTDEQGFRELKKKGSLNFIHNLTPFSYSGGFPLYPILQAFWLWQNAPAMNRCH